MPSIPVNSTSKNVKLKIDGKKYKGVIVRDQVDVQELDVTLGGSLGGPPPDTFHRTMPGRVTRILTIEIVDGPS